MQRDFIKRLYFSACLCALCSVFMAGKLKAQQSSTATGISKVFNPAIGVNGLFLGTYTDLEEDDSEVEGDGHDLGGDAFRTGLHIQELEIGLRAVVDPYFKAAFLLAMHDVGSIEIEEMFLQTTRLPRGFGITVGKFYLPFGKQNRLHTHASPMIDKQWIHASLLGNDGLNDVAVQLSYLAPLPWYSEVSLAAFDPGDESVFVTANNKDLGYVVNWRNLWDITSSTTLEWGISWAGAKTARADSMETLLSPFGHGNRIAGADESKTGLNIIGSDITLKHVSTNYHSWDFSTEYLQGIAATDKKVEAQLGGITAYSRYQLNRRWWVQGRADMLGLPLTGNSGRGESVEALETGDTPWRITVGPALVLSEFTVIRLQYDYMDRIIENPENRVLLQLNITFGAHPAHTY